MITYSCNMTEEKRRWRQLVGIKRERFRIALSCDTSKVISHRVGGPEVGNLKGIGGVAWKKKRKGGTEKKMSKKEMSEGRGKREG